MSDQEKDPFTTTFHPKYTEIANAYMDIMAASTPVLPKRQDTPVDLKTYLADYRTIMMGGPRQTGMRSWVADHADSESLIICNKQYSILVMDKLLHVKGPNTENHPCLASIYEVDSHDLRIPHTINRVYVLDTLAFQTRYHVDRFYERISKYLNEQAIIFMMR